MTITQPTKCSNVQANCLMKCLHFNDEIFHSLFLFNFKVLCHKKARVIKGYLLRDESIPILHHINPIKTFPKKKPKSLKENFEKKNETLIFLCLPLLQVCASTSNLRLSGTNFLKRGKIKHIFTLLIHEGRDYYYNNYYSIVCLWLGHCSTIFNLTTNKLGWESPDKSMSRLSKKRIEKITFSSIYFNSQNDRKIILSFLWCKCWSKNDLLKYFL